MARIISTGETPAKVRNAHMRSCAEVLRLLAQRASFGAEEMDMVAFLVFSLRGIYQTIEDSAGAWDERDYWKKAEELRARWSWSRRAADELERIVREERWSDVPATLVALVPHFNDVTVVSITRDSDWWCGALRALLREQSHVRPR
ncbi:MAG TPA: hypothetical protein VF190_14830 [Rhodothermales bacterium]